jgi:hypothetical protein
MSDKPKDYEVGYGRPPKASRFKPGQSGNPRGRLRGQSNLATDLARELGEQIRIREGDQEKSVSKQRAMVKALVAKSLKGDARAAALLISLLVKVEEQADRATPPSKAVSSQDQAIIDAFFKRAGKLAAGPAGEND